MWLLEVGEHNNDRSMLIVKYVKFLSGDFRYNNALVHAHGENNNELRCYALRYLFTLFSPPPGEIVWASIHRNCSIGVIATKDGGIPTNPQLFTYADFSIHL